MAPTLTHVLIVMMAVLTLAGLDLLFGAKLMKGLSQIFNRKVDVDNIVIRGLASLRLQSEKEFVRIDEKTLQGRLRVFLAVLLLMPAAMLFYVLFLRK